MLENEKEKKQLIFSCVPGCVMASSCAGARALALITIKRRGRRSRRTEEEEEEEGDE